MFWIVSSEPLEEELFFPHPPPIMLAARALTLKAIMDFFMGWLCNLVEVWAESALGFLTLAKKRPNEIVDVRLKEAIRFVICGIFRLLVRVRRVGQQPFEIHRLRVRRRESRTPLRRERDEHLVV